MTVKRVVPREQADRDAGRAIDHYAREAGAETALGFVDALEAAYRTIAEHPGIGAPRYAHELDLPGLRHRRLARYPWLVPGMAVGTMVILPPATIRKSRRKAFQPHFWLMA